MNIIKCIHTNSSCYKYNTSNNVTANQVGIVVHSTGANNTQLKRYVQPSADDPNRGELLKIIGVNPYSNSWNRTINKSTHYFIGKLANGDVGVAQILPEDMPCWAIGNGRKGSYNYNPTAHIQFEICEDGLKDKAYFTECYNAAVNLCAEICRNHGWESSVIVSHHEAYLKGYGSNHADIDHWLKKFGMTMNDFRKDVDIVLHPAKDPEVGDIVMFKGTKHYSNANALLGKSCKPGKAKLMRIYRLGKSRHPYLVRYVAGSGSTVNGWVNEKDIEVLRNGS